MGKLVKINNQQQTTGAITAYFQEGFTIPPMGTIGLINMSCEMEEKNILISDDNNTFKRRVIAGGAEVNVVIRNGLYGIMSFIGEANRALNASLQNVAGAQQGFQFKVSLTDRQFIKISFNRVAIGTSYYYIAGRTNWVVGAVANGTNGFTKNIAGGSWNAAIMSQKHFIDGAGAFTCRLYGDGEMIIGLVNSSVQASYDGVYDLEAYHHCLYIAPNSVDGAFNVYWVKTTNQDGIVEITEIGIAPGITDVMGIMLSGGKLHFISGDLANPYINDPNIVLMHEIDWEYDKRYFGMLSLYGANQRVDNVNFWNDPYHQITQTFSHYHEEAPEYNLRIDDVDEPVIDNPDVGGAPTSIVSLIMNPPVLSLFGFQANPPPSPNAKSGSFLGTRPYTNVVLPHNMKIILDNLAIESYDNVIKQHESILMTIPSLTADDGKFIYNAQFPLQIELKNKFPLNISELRLRLVDFQRNLIKIKPDVTDITLFIS